MSLFNIIQEVTSAAGLIVLMLPFFLYVKYNLEFKPNTNDIITNIDNCPSALNAVTTAA